MKYRFDYTSKFKKDYRKLSKQSIIDEVDTVIKKTLRWRKARKKISRSCLNRKL